MNSLKTVHDSTEKWIVSSIISMLDYAFYIGCEHDADHDRWYIEDLKVPTISFLGFLVLWSVLFHQYCVPYTFITFNLSRNFFLYEYRIYMYIGISSGPSTPITNTLVWKFKEIPQN